MPYTPEQMRDYLQALKEYRNHLALGRTPPPFPPPLPAENEPLPRPSELRRIDRLIRVVESELPRFEVYREITIERIQPNGRKAVATVDLYGKAAILADGESPRWSPDGKRIAYQSTSSTGRWQISIVDAAGATPSDFSKNPSVHEMSPTWSPMGDEIAFESDRGNGWQIYARKVTAPGSPPRAITSGPGHHVNPAWSPKGDVIACSIFSAPVTWSWTDAQIYLVPADGSQSFGVQVTKDPNVVDSFDARWSPDGRHIVFDAGSKSAYPLGYIYVVDVGGSGIARQLTTIPFTALPTWSPDGSAIAYWAWPNMQDAGIYVVDPSGTRPPKKWPGTASTDDSPDWQPS